MVGSALQASASPRSTAQRRVSALAALSAKALDETAELDALFRAAAAHADDGIQTGWSQLLQYRPVTGDFLLRAGVGWAGDLIGRMAFAADAAAPTTQVLRTGKPLAIDNLPDRPQFLAPGPLRERGVVALLGVPVQASGRGYGVIEVAADRPRRFGPDDIEFLQAIANVLGAAIRRKEVEGALREQEERLRFGLAANRMVAWDWDLATGISTRSDNAVEVFGLGSGTVETFSRMIHPEDRPRVEAALAAARHGDALFDVEFRVLTPDGRVVWLAEKARLRPGPDGRPTHLVGVCTDITERKRAEEALRTSEARFRATFEQAAVGLAHVGLDGRWLRVNRRLCEITGYDEDELLRKRHQDITHPNDLAADLANAERLLAGGDGKRAMERRYIRKDGRPIWIRLTVSLVRDEERGAPGYFVCAVEDIDRKKRIETAAREREERLRAALYASGTGTYRRDLRGNLVSRDENLRQLYGMPIEEKAGANRDAAEDETLGHVDDLLERVHPEDRAALAAAVERSVREGADFDIDYRVILPDGSLRWVSDKGRTFFDERGRPLYTTGACIDVTERREAEEHRKLLLAELNHRVRNTLAVVQSIAAQTLRRATSLESFGESFAGRLRALAAAHGLLTQANWRSTRLEKVVRQTLKAHGTAARALDIGGPALALSPRQTLGLGLVLHELATNAAKYGALSVPSGRIEVRWNTEERDGRPHLRLDWTERGGPPVTAPREPGFGTTLIERTVAYDLGGRADLTYAPDGLRCRILIPREG